LDAGGVGRFKPTHWAAVLTVVAQHHGLDAAAVRIHAAGAQGFRAAEFELLLAQCGLPAKAGIGASITESAIAANKPSFECVFI